METNTNEMRQQLQRLAKSYTPEWHYTQENPDAGSVLGILVADMLENSRQHLDRVMHKHKIQYLNQFDALMKEPVSAARGYVQFTPVAGSDSMMAVPRGTELSAQTDDNEILFETLHDICLTDSGLTSVFVTDGKTDKIVFHAKAKREDRLEEVKFKAFDINGENKASHTCFFCFDTVPGTVSEVNLLLQIQAEKPEEAEKTAKLMASAQVELGMAEPVGEDGFQFIPFDSVKAVGSELRLWKEAYKPQKAVIDGYEGYFIIARITEEVPELVMSGISLVMEKEDIIPDSIWLEGIDTQKENFSPFGAPLQLLSECSMDSEEVFSKKNANITVSFELDYEIKEEKLELPEVDIEYKAVMKRPPEAAYAQPSAVCADRVVWEYLSKKGWKSLEVPSGAEQLFGGEKDGEITVSFVCPTDIETEAEGEPRIRLRLMQADNIYKIPAVYKCPVIRHLRLAYSYEGRAQLPKSVRTINNYQVQQIEGRFKDKMNTVLFYTTERPERCMYLGFDESIQGLPFSLYFDLENYSDLPIDFTVEYGRENDFKPIRIVDGTNGFLNSGSMQFLISGDITKQKLFGCEGYFLRFVSYEKEHPDYRLPKIKGIYPNVVKVENQSTSTEYFYIEDKNEPLEIKLSEENLRQLTVWIHEEKNGEPEWVEWRPAVRSYEQGRVYRKDMAEGSVAFGDFAFTDIALSDDGPHIRIDFRHYEGGVANLPKDSIITLRDSNRFVSEVTNPFPTYGGYDIYTEESTAGFITGVLRSRNRAVTQRDIFDILRQVSYSVIRVKSRMDVDALGNPDPDTMTVAVLTKEYDKGAHIFQEMREEMLRKLKETGNFLIMGRKVKLIQPHFLKLNVRVWIKKDTMENAYDLQHHAQEIIEQFLNPIYGGLEGKGWQIGTVPRVSQIRAYLRKQLNEAAIARMAVTTMIDDREVEIREDSTILGSPFVLPVSGEHVIHIELKE